MKFNRKITGTISGSLKKVYDSLYNEEKPFSASVSPSKCFVIFTTKKHEKYFNKLMEHNDVKNITNERL